MKIKRLLVLLLLYAVAGASEGLRRHGRHRRVSGPDPVVLNGRVVKDEQKENQHKPSFERCDDYLPEVLEQSPAGKFFISFIFIKPLCVSSLIRIENRHQRVIAEVFVICHASA